MELYQIGSMGEKVKMIQRVLNHSMGLDLDVDGVYGKKTAAAVSLYQEEKGLSISGLVDITTLKEMGLYQPEQEQAPKPVPPAPKPPVKLEPINPKPIPITTPPSLSGKFTGQLLADIAVAEATKHLTWNNSLDSARKYTVFFEPWFGPGRIPWCAAFVSWCVRQAGIKQNMTPIDPVDNMPGYCWALVEEWQQWGIEQKFYHDNDGSYQPEAGDLVIFDWTQTNIDQPDVRWQDHIGIHVKMEDGWYICAEGNTGNDTAIPNVKRRAVQIKGWVKLPAGLQAL